MDEKDYDLIFYRTYSDALMPYNFMSSVFKNNDGKSGVLANDKTLTRLDDFPTTVSKKNNSVHLMKYLNTLINNIIVCLLLIQMKPLSLVIK